MITATMSKAARIADVDTRADKPDLERLYAAHAPTAFRTAYLLTGDEALARDLVQDAFVKLAGRFRDLRNPDAFPAYLRQTIVNLARNHWRRTQIERRYLRREERRGPHAQEMPDVETRSELRDALAHLSHRHRTALVLRYFEDLSEQQVADALGCSAAAAKSLIHRATESLRAHLKGDGS
ncbi:MAG TPA: SigE family RNA polymerase sigma factor [Actinomycetota bacterium]|nr:SigE family RNA polymerase sigma factor [Actinomycetota bacterium]